MHVLIVGAGIIGTLTAYYLGTEGIKVTVLDRQDDVAQEASGANASQLSFGSLYPVGSPSRLKDAFESLLGLSAYIDLQSKTDPHFWRWGMAFMYQCLPFISHRNLKELLELSVLSKNYYEELITAHNLSFSHKKNGRLRLYSTPRAFEKARKEHERSKQCYGIDYQYFTKEKCLHENPILAHRKGEIEGGLLMPESSVGDTAAFCQDLRRVMIENKMDVTFKTGVNIETIEKENNGTIKYLKTCEGEEIVSDIYVLCTGADTPLLLRKLGYDLNLYPIKGHTIALPYEGACQRDQISHNIVDIKRAVVIAPLDKTIRFSSGMVFDRHNKAEDPDALLKLKKSITEIIPDVDLKKAQIHTGLRPAMPSSLPVAKRMGESNLFINTGHGMWGWTLGPVTCTKMARLIKEAA